MKNNHETPRYCNFNKNFVPLNLIDFVFISCLNKTIILVHCSENFNDCIISTFYTLDKPKQGVPKLLSIDCLSVNWHCLRMCFVRVSRKSRVQCFMTLLISGLYL